LAAAAARLRRFIVHSPAVVNRLAVALVLAARKLMNKTESDH